MIERINMTQPAAMAKMTPAVTAKAQTEETAKINQSDQIDIKSLPILENPSKAVKTLVSDFGYAEFPQVSPDGDKVIFNVVGNYTTSQMFIMDKDGDNVKSLFLGDKIDKDNVGEFLAWNDGKTDEQGTWSHDGKSVYYRTNKNGTFDVARFDLEEHKQEVVVADPDRNMKHPVETEEGYIVGYGGPPGKQYKTSEEFSDIFLANPKDGTYQMLTHSDGSVSYKHPSTIDGKILAHKEPKHAANENADIVTIDPKTGEETNLTKTPNADERHPFFNKEVGLMAFHSDESGDKNIWLSDPSGEPRCQLTFYGKAAQSPCWSPDGKKIYFVKKKEREPEGEPFYVRQADIRVIDVEDALKDLKEQAADRYKDLKENNADKALLDLAKQEYKTYSKFLKKFD